MPLHIAQQIADNCQNGNGHTYSQEELRAAEEVLWSAARVDFHRLDAIFYWRK